MDTVDTVDTVDKVEKRPVPSREYLASLGRLLKGDREITKDDIVSLGDVRLGNGEVLSQEYVSDVLGFIDSAGTLSDLYGINADELEAIYSLGKTYIENDEIEKGHLLFQYLCVQNHLNARYWLALGKSQVRLSKIEQALSSYSFGSMLSKNDPEFPLSCAEIHLMRGDLDNAAAGASMAIAYYNAMDSKQPSILKRANSIISAVDRLVGDVTTSGEEA